MMKFSTLVANSSFLTSNSPKISPKISPIFDSYSYNYTRRHNPKHKDCIFANGLLKIPSNSSRFRPVCFNGTKEFSNQDTKFEVDSVKRGDFAEENSNLKVEIGTPKFANLMPVKMSLSDQAFFLLTFVACTTTVAFTSLVIATVPTLYAMARAATSLAKLADTAREELPSTMAAIRLSGMEISDLTLELSDLSQEIADGVTKSTQAVQAAEAGIRQIGSVARQQTMSMIQERANLPVIALQPAVVGAAKKTSQAVGRATKSLMYFISRGEHKNDDDIDKVEL